jgi:hypothetical protein
VSRSQSPAPRPRQPVSLAAPSPTAVTPPAWPGLALQGLVVTSTVIFPAQSAVEAAQSDRPCLFASGEASGSERPRLPPQVGPQPTHPVRQDITWHPEVSGDVAVMPAIYNPALQQSAVVVDQIPEEGAKSVTFHGLHWGDLATTMTGFSVVHRAAVAPSVPCTSLASDNTVRFRTVIIHRPPLPWAFRPTPEADYVADGAPRENGRERRNPKTFWCRVFVTLETAQFRDAY